MIFCNSMGSLGEVRTLPNSFKRKILTDNSIYAEAYIDVKMQLTSFDQRWIPRLSLFDLSIKYRARNLNSVAFSLSKLDKV